MVGAAREVRIDEEYRESQAHHNRLVTHGEGEARPSVGFLGAVTAGGNEGLGRGSLVSRNAHQVSNMVAYMGP